jgi:hypothetical protein
MFPKVFLKVRQCFDKRPERPERLGHDATLVLKAALP